MNKLEPSIGVWYKDIQQKITFEVVAIDDTELSIETHIRIFEDEILEINDSGLTVLLKLLPLDSKSQTVRTVHASYLCGENPEMIVDTDK